MCVWWIVTLDAASILLFLDIWLPGLFITECIGTCGCESFFCVPGCGHNQLHIICIARFKWWYFMVIKYPWLTAGTVKLSLSMFVELPLQSLSSGWYSFSPVPSLGFSSHSHPTLFSSQSLHYSHIPGHVDWDRSNTPEAWSRGQSSETRVRIPPSDLEKFNHKPRVTQRQTALMIRDRGIKI